jgi:hypothetical protein
LIITAVRVFKSHRVRNTTTGPWCTACEHSFNLLFVLVLLFKLPHWQILQDFVKEFGKVVPYLRWLVAGFPPRRSGFEPSSGYVRFVVDKVALGKVFSEYFGFLCRFSFHWLLHTHHLSAAAGTIGQIVADVPSGLNLTPTQRKKN